MAWAHLSFRQGVVVPEGLGENSPAFQRREGQRRALSPEGTAEIGGHQSSLRDLRPIHAKPGVETPGYYRLSLRDGCASHRNLSKNWDAPPAYFHALITFSATLPPETMESPRDMPSR